MPADRLDEACALLKEALDALIGYRATLDPHTLTSRIEVRINAFLRSVETNTGPLDRTAAAFVPAATAQPDGVGARKGPSGSVHSSSGPTPDAGDDGLPSIGGERMDRTIVAFVQACRVLLRDEQEKVSPDTAIIGVLCDAVRLTREYASVATSPAPAPAAKVVEAAEVLIGSHRYQGFEAQRSRQTAFDALRAAVREYRERGGGA